MWHVTVIISFELENHIYEIEHNWITICVNNFKRKLKSKLKITWTKIQFYLKLIKGRNLLTFKEKKIKTHAASIESIFHKVFLTKRHEVLTEREKHKLKKDIPKHTFLTIPRNRDNQSFPASFHCCTTSVFPLE